MQLFPIKRNMLNLMLIILVVREFNCIVKLWLVSCEWCLRDAYIVYMTALSELNCGAEQDVYGSAINWCVSARLKYALSVFIKWLVDSEFLILNK